MTKRRRTVLWVAAALIVLAAALFLLLRRRPAAFTPEQLSRSDGKSGDDDSGSGPAHEGIPLHQ